MNKVEISSNQNCLQQGKHIELPDTTKGLKKREKKKRPFHSSGFSSEGTLMSPDRTPWCKMHIKLLDTTPGLKEAEKETLL